MKKINLIKLKIAVITLLIVSCNKEECINENVTCIETEPEGYMVTTMEDYNGNTNVATIYKTTFNSNAPVGGDWNNPALGAGQVSKIATPMWNTASVGQVFGIAIDNGNNIYLASTDIYAYDPYGGTTVHGSAGSAGIYKTNVSTPTTTTSLTTTLVANTGYTVGTNQIPNTGIGAGNSLGNIAFDKEHNQLFATNLEDGRIYRIDATTGIV
jgi:hypothetical protein